MDIVVAKDGLFVVLSSVSDGKVALGMNRQVATPFAAFIDTET